MTVPTLSHRNAATTLEAPAEKWEQLAEKYRAWMSRHERLSAFLFKFSRITQRISLGLFVLALIFIPRLGIAMVPAIFMLACLGVMALLARTRTVLWRSLTLLLTLSALWAYAVAGFTIFIAYLGGMNAHYDGAMVSLAAFIEESGKLFPLLVFVLVAPGRMRRLAAVDWALLGFASGAGFTIAEDGVRRLVPPGLLASVLGEDRLEYSLNPWYSGRFSSYGYSWWDALHNGDFLGAQVSGHHVSTMTVAAAIGLGIWLWRWGKEHSHWGRFLSPLPAAASLLLVIADHAAFNATIVSGNWLQSGEGFPLWLRLVWFAGNGGHLQVPLSVCLFVLCSLVDARRRLAAGAVGLTSVHAPAVWVPDFLAWPKFLRSVLQAGTVLVSFAASDLVMILGAYTNPAWDRGLRMSMGRGRGREVLRVRAEAMSYTTVGAEPQARRRFRLIAGLWAVLVGVFCVAVGLVIARDIGLSLWTQGDGLFFAGLFDNLASFWENLSFGQQILLIALGVMLLTAGGASLGLALGAVGVGTWAFSHGHGLASFIRDPRAATVSYFRNVTPGQLAWDLLDFALTFIPGSVLGAAGRAVFRIPFGSMESSLAVRLGAQRQAERLAEQFAREVSPTAAAQTARETLGLRSVQAEELQGLFVRREALRVSRLQLETQLRELMPEGFTLQDFSRGRLKDTIWDLQNSGISPQRYETILEFVSQRQAILREQPRLGEFIGVRGGEQALANEGFEIPAAFRSTTVETPGPGPFHVDALAVSTARSGNLPAELSIVEYKGGTARLSTRPVQLLYEPNAAQGSVAYIRDRMLRDERVIQYFADNPQVWGSLSNLESPGIRLTSRVYYTQAPSGALPPDVTEIPLTPRIVQAISERIAAQ